MSMDISISRLMNDSGVKFGTSGARGLVADMTDRICFAYALAFLRYAVSKPGEPEFHRIAVAGDLRSSSPRIVRAVCRAAEELELMPIDCGMIPSPAVALYGLEEKIPAIMITGSHIPDDRNGIKFNLASGEILKNDEAALKQTTVTIPENLFDDAGMLKTEVYPTTTSSDNGIAKKRYIERFQRAFPKTPLAGFRIGLYEHSAVGRDLLYQLYSTLGAKVTRLGRSNHFVSVDTEAVREEDLQSAKAWALGNERDTENSPFDAIVSTDGDSDRPLLFDEHGGWIRGDMTGILTARFLLADCVVTPVSSSTALERCGWFKKIVRTKIGSPYVVEAMRHAVDQGFKRVVGYEGNGGFLTANSMLLDEDDSYAPLTALPTRDPAIVHLASLCFARRNGVSLSRLGAVLPRRIVMSDRLQHFPSELAQRKIEELTSGGLETTQLVFAAFGELATVDWTDGVRMVFGDDIVHVRASGNAPEFRVYTESDTKERAASLLYKTMMLVDSWRRRSQHDAYPYQH